MAQTLARQTRSKKSNRQTPENNSVIAASNEVAGIANAADFMNSDSALEHAAHLGDPNMQTIQRQKIIRQIGQMQGNHLLQQALSTHYQNIQRDPDPKQTGKIGWSDASQENAQTSQPVTADKIQVPQDTGWNGGEIKVGSIRRILISGLKHGRQSNAETHSGYSGSTTESAGGKAVVLIPDDFDETDERPTTVLLHLHGFGSGYRQLDDPVDLKQRLDELKAKKGGLEQDLASKQAQKPTSNSELNKIRTQIGELEKQIAKVENQITGKLDYAKNLQPGQVRDIELYRMEQQLDQLHKERQTAKKASKAGGPQIIAVLPQGGSSSEFGDITSNPLGYLKEVLDVLPQKIKNYNLSVSGHSGGGPGVMAVAEAVRTHKRKPDEPEHKVNQIILFDAINGSNESKTVQDWLQARIATDRRALAKQKTMTDVDNYFKSRTAFRGYFSPGYTGLYEKVKIITDELSKAKTSKPNPSVDEYKLNKLAEHYQVIGPIGEKVKPAPGKKRTAEEEFRPHEHLLGAKNDPSKYGLLYEALSALP
jgi:hypothetical protein